MILVGKVERGERKRTVDEVSKADLVRTLLGFSCVVNHQHGIAATHKLICLNQQFCLQRPSTQTPAAMKWRKIDRRRKSHLAIG
jgi:hypothetical protein